MKIISGKYKGRNIQGFDIDGTRPTMERVKESLFAMIQDKMKDAIVLDLFSGSGNIGIEALSEGASYAYLCDHNHKAIQVMNKNLKEIGIEDVKVIESDYLKCLNLLKDIKLDIIFLDPPYQTDYIEKSLIKIEELSILNKNGIVVCESDSIDKIVYSDYYSCIKERKYGDKIVVILEKL